MADNFSLCLIGAMDCLWFHQIILFPQPFSLYFPKTLKPQQQPYSACPSSTTTTTTSCPSSSLSLSSLAEDFSTAVVCPLPDQEKPDDSKNEEEELQVKKRPRRGSLSSGRSRSHSSSPSSTQKRQRNHHKHSTSSCSLIWGKLQKSMSCSRSLKDLELEEVKGFMDLGFIFTKEHLNARMISVVPGLLRLGLISRRTKRKTELNLTADHEQEDKRGVIRPYLSEAWLIKTPDSPLLNLRAVPSVSAAADMKKHLKFWARTVASVVQQES